MHKVLFGEASLGGQNPYPLYTFNGKRYAFHIFKVDMLEPFSNLSIYVAAQPLILCICSTSTHSIFQLVKSILFYITPVSRS